MSSNIKLFVLTFFEGSSQFLFNLNFKRDENIISFPSRHEMSLRCLNQISIERDFSKTSKKHLKRDVFYVTSLRHLKYISKKMSFLLRL